MSAGPLKLNVNAAQVRQSPADRLQEIQQKTQDAAKMYEKLFLREMVKAMRQTVPESGLVKKSQAEAIFQEQLDSEYVEKWGNKGGVGLADVIYDQIIDRFGIQMGLKPRPEKPSGPLPMQRMPLQPGDVRVHPAPNGVTVQMKNLQKSDAPAEILSPWKGVLLDYSQMEDGRWLGEIGHDNGLTSQFLHSGSKLLDPPLRKGETVEAGQKVGLLSPAGGEFFWRIRSGDSASRQVEAGTMSSVEKDISL